MPWRLAFWNDPHNPGNAVQCIDYPGARAGTHRLGQLVAAKVTHLRDLVIWLPRIARQHASSQEKHHVVLVWLGVDTDEPVSNHIQARFLKHLALQCGELRLA